MKSGKFLENCLKLLINIQFDLLWTFEKNALPLCVCHWAYGYLRVLYKIVFIFN